MDWTGLWRVDSPDTTPLWTLHTHTLTMESFLTAGDVYSATGVSYDAHAALDGALRYAAVDSNIGAESVRKVVKTVKMLADPEWWVLVEKEAADATTSIAAGKAKGKGKAK